MQGQFTVYWNNGGTTMVDAKDKYEAIEKAKKLNPHNSGVREVRQNGKVV